MKYNYLENEINDVKEYIKENLECETVEELEGIDKDVLYDDLFIEDTVTGNGSGSYTFNAYEAEKNLCHNMDLLKEACEMFCCEPKLDCAEWCDVTIRCYLLSQAIDEAINELIKELEV